METDQPSKPSSPSPAGDLGLRLRIWQRVLIALLPALAMFAATYAIALRAEVKVIVDTCGPRQEQRRLRDLENIVGEYQSTKHQLPSSIDQLEFVPPGIAATSQPQDYLWRQPYTYEVSVRPLDFWGHPYVIRPYGKDGKDFEIISLGRDGKPGGEGLDADLSSKDYYGDVDRYRPTHDQYMELANFGRMGVQSFLAALAVGIMTYTCLEKNLRPLDLVGRGVVVAILITFVMAFFAAAAIASLHFVPQYGH